MEMPVRVLALEISRNWKHWWSLTLAGEDGNGNLTHLFQGLTGDPLGKKLVTLSYLSLLGPLGTERAQVLKLCCWRVFCNNLCLILQKWVINLVLGNWRFSVSKLRVFSAFSFVFLIALDHVCFTCSLKILFIYFYVLVLAWLSYNILPLLLSPRYLHLSFKFTPVLRLVTNLFLKIVLLSDKPMHEKIFPLILVGKVKIPFIWTRHLSSFHR